MYETLTVEHETAEKYFGREIRADKLRLLYEQSFLAVYFSLASASLLVVILWPHTSWKLLLGWLVALGISSVMRIGLFLSYGRANPSSTEILAWERPYQVTLMLSSAIWGFGSLLIIPSDPFLYAIVAYCFLIGLGGGALSAYSAIHSFAITTMAIVMLPATFWMLAKGETTPVLLGIAAILLFFSFLRASKVLSDALRQNFLMAHQLKESKEAAEQLARIDTLTGLYNRRAFNELSENAVQRCQRSGMPYAAIVLDIDHFKSINDKQGHAIGDLALKHVAGIVQNSIRRTDVCARVGGEEFAVLLPDTEAKAAMIVAEKIRESIVQQPLETVGGPLVNTASLGVACRPVELEALLQHADSAMYEAKQTGRNKVVCYDGHQLKTGAGNNIV